MRAKSVRPRANEASALRFIATRSIDNALAAKIVPLPKRSRGALIHALAASTAADTGIWIGK
jgi:hypothetical protein